MSYITKGSFWRHVRSWAAEACVIGINALSAGSPAERGLPDANGRNRFETGENGPTILRQLMAWINSQSQVVAYSSVDDTRGSEQSGQCRLAISEAGIRRKSLASPWMRGHILGSDKAKS